MVDKTITLTSDNIGSLATAIGTYFDALKNPKNANTKELIEKWIESQADVENSSIISMGMVEHLATVIKTRFDIRNGTHFDVMLELFHYFKEQGLLSTQVAMPSEKQLWRHAEGNIYEIVVVSKEYNERTEEWDSCVVTYKDVKDPSMNYTQSITRFLNRFEFTGKSAGAVCQNQLDGSK